MATKRDPSSGLAGLTARLDAASTSLPHYPQLPALQQMQAQWAQVHEQSRLRVALHQAPAEGGPLNSAVLVHRMLDMMRTVSPQYLRCFVGHADALAWLEATLPAAVDGLGSGKPAKSVKARAPRTRKRPEP